MSLILDVPLSVELERSRAAVRSGSALSPQERFKLDRQGYKREYQHALYDDAVSKNTAAIAPDNGRSRTEHDACIGMPLHSDTFISRLTKLNPSLWFERANADHEKMGVYLLVPISIEYLEGKKFLFGFHIGIMPEFTLEKTPDEDGEGVGILRQGWRTILMRLIRLRLISLEKAEVMFGQPSFESAYWAVLTGKRNSID